MTAVQCTALLSALLGAFGTIVLFFNSYTLEPFEGGGFNSEAMQERNDQVKAKNKKRKFGQQIGLGLLCLSFVVQAISVISS